MQARASTRLLRNMCTRAQGTLSSKEPGCRQPGHQSVRGGQRYCARRASGRAEQHSNRANLLSPERQMATLLVCSGDCRLGRVTDKFRPLDGSVDLVTGAVPFGGGISSYLA